MDTITTIQSLLTCNGSAQRVTVDLTQSELRLIAAAPELARAAQMAWGALAWIIAYDSEDKILARAMAELEAAIQKSGTFDFKAMRAKVEADQKTIARENSQ